MLTGDIQAPEGGTSFGKIVGVDSVTREPLAVDLICLHQMVCTAWRFDRQHPGCGSRHATGRDATGDPQPDQCTSGSEHHHHARADHASRASTQIIVHRARLAVDPGTSTGHSPAASRPVSAARKTMDQAAGSATCRRHGRSRLTLDAITAYRPARSRSQGTVVGGA